MSVHSTDRESYEFLEFKLEGPIEPNDLQYIAPRILQERKGRPVLILSGRGPIWLYGALIHETVHVVKVLAVWDPKLSAAVVIASHAKGWKVGDLIYPEM